MSVRPFETKQRKPTLPSRTPKSKQCKRKREKPMRTWRGGGAGGLTVKIEQDLRRRSNAVLKRHFVSDKEIPKIVDGLVEIVSKAVAGSNLKLVAKGPGRPVHAAATLLAVDVDDWLREHGLRGNRVRYDGDGELSSIGLIAEIWGIAQTALRLACGEATAAKERPARICDARKILGQVHRTVWEIERTAEQSARQDRIETTGKNTDDIERYFSQQLDDWPIPPPERCATCNHHFWVRSEYAAGMRPCPISILD
jgi:hypothetical protein